MGAPVSASIPTRNRSNKKTSAAAHSELAGHAGARPEPGWHLLHSALPSDPASIPIQDSTEEGPSSSDSATGRESAGDVPALVECKPPVESADDPLEQEADTMAQRALNTPPPSTPARPAGPFQSAGPAPIDAAPPHRRAEEDSVIPADAPPSVRDALRSSGQPLDRPTRLRMEQHFGRSFANVRIHTGPAAEASAAALNALAYTAGCHIVFGRGQLRPDASDGLRLLAHELTHVMRQAEGHGRGTIQTKAAKPAGPSVIHFKLKVDRPMTPDELLREFVRQYYRLHTEAQVEKKLEIWHWDNGKGRSATEADVHRKFLILKVADYSQLQMASMSEDQKKEINKQADDRFWDQTGYKPHERLGNSPKDQEMAREWMSVRTDILHENEQLRAIDALDDDIKKILFAGGRKITPDDYSKVLHLASRLSKLTPGQRQDYLSKVVVDTDDFDQLEAAIDHYQLSLKVEEAEEEKTDEAAEKLFGLEDLYKLYKAKDAAWRAYGKTVSHGGSSQPLMKAAQDADAQFTLALKQNHFDNERDFESAMEVYRLRFRAEAVHIAMEILARYEQVLFLARKKYQNPANAAALAQNIGATQAKQHYQEASEKSTEAVMTRIAASRQGTQKSFESDLKAMALDAKSHQLTGQAEGEVIKASGQDPVVDPAQLGRGTDREKLASLDAAETQQYMLQVIQDREEDLARARYEFTDDPDRIFSLAGLVEATKHTQSIGEDTIYAWIVRDYIEAQQNAHLFTAVVLGILALILAFLVPGGGWLAAAALVTSAGISTVQAIEAIQEYNQGETEFRLGFIEDEPSLVWVVVAIAGAALDMGMAASAVLKMSAPALKELEAPLKAFSEASDAETAAKRLEELNAKIRQVEGLDARVKAAMEAKAAAELGLKQAAGKMMGKMFAIGGAVDVTPVFEGLYYGIKKGASTFTKLRGDAEMLKLMGDVTKMSGAAREELKTAFDQVKRIVALGKKAEMDEATVLKFVDRLAAQRSAGEGVFEVITEEMSAWRKPTAEQAKAASALTEASETLTTFREEKSELEAELRAGPKTPDGKPDLKRVEEIRKDLRELEDDVRIDRDTGKQYVHREGRISHAERGVRDAEAAADKAALDPKDVMRSAFGSSKEREAVINGAKEDQVSKIAGGKLKTPPKSLTVDHVVSIKQISKMDGFEKLTRAERKLLAIRQDNLIVMDASANFSKGERSWSAWKQFGTFYDDATKEAMLAKEGDLRKQIQDWIKNQVKGR